MITREQAEKAFYERYSQVPTHPEFRNVVMKEIGESQIEYWRLGEEVVSVFDFADHAWEVTFEIRHLRLSLGQPTGTYDEWSKRTCYIVEPKPGVYVVD